MSDTFWICFFGFLTTLVTIISRWLGWIDNADTKKKVSQIAAAVNG
jgi:hypothetical protein